MDRVLKSLRKKCDLQRFCKFTTEWTTVKCTTTFFFKNLHRKFCQMICFS